MRTSILCFLLAATPAFAQRRAPSPAAGSATAAAADTAKLGTYDLEITTADGTMTGVLALTRTAGTTVAELQAGPNKPTVKSFASEHGHYLLTVGHGTFSIVYTLVFVRDSVSGSFVGSSGVSGTVIGARRR